MEQKPLGMENQTNLEKNLTSVMYRKPYCYTTVSWRTMLSPNQNLAIGLCYSVTIIPAVLFNSAFCYALYKTDQLKKKSRLLVFLISLSDLLSGLFIIPASVVLFTVYGNSRVCLFERLLMLCGQTNGHLSLYLLILLAIQRYFAVSPNAGVISNRFVNAALFSSNGLKLVLATAVIWSLFHGLVSIYFFGQVTSTIPNIMVMTIRAVLLILTYVLYFRLYFTMRRHQMAMAEYRGPSKHPSPVQQALIEKWFDAFSTTIFLVLVVYAISFTPVIVTDCWTGFYTFRNVYAPDLARFMYYLLHSTLFLNSSLNAAVFLYRDETSRSFLRQIFLSNKPNADTVALKAI